MKKFYALVVLLGAMALNLAAQPKILYIGARSPEEIEPSDEVTVNYLVDKGMEVTVIEDDDVSSGGYDFSPYDAVVFGESVSSSNIVSFGTVDHYPAPCVILEPLCVRDDKWNWIKSRDNWIEERGKLLGWDRLQILDETHYVTQGFTKDQVVTWSTADTAGRQLFAYGFNLAVDVPAAVPLAKNLGSGTSFPCIWAVDAGTTAGGYVLAHRMLINGTHAKGIADDDAGTVFVTEDFLVLIHRSVKWVLGGEVGIREEGSGTRGVRVSPNPAGDLAEFFFNLEQGGEVSLKVMNLLGQTVRSTEMGFRAPGRNKVECMVSDLPGGLYLYLLESQGESHTGKFQVVH